MVNYEQGIHEAIEHLCSLGHTRIGFISGPVSLPSIQRRKQAFIEKMPKELSRPLAIIDSDGSFQGGYFCCSKLLSASPLTAIICANDLIALGAVHCARDKGLRIPEDLSVVGFDNTVIATYSYPALTAVQNPRDVIARLAIEAIREMMESPTHKGQGYEVPTELIVRESTAPPPNA
jgi:LacI family transcriptional regulator